MDSPTLGPIPWQCPYQSAFSKTFEESPKDGWNRGDHRPEQTVFPFSWRQPKRKNRNGEIPCTVHRVSAARSRNAESVRRVLRSVPIATGEIRPVRGLFVFAGCRIRR